MATLHEIEQAVQRLSEDELAEFRAWFANFDQALWDERLERDVESGRVDALAEEALRDHRAGRTRPL